MFSQCPKCKSVFMVDERALSAHQALVRCGQCYSVFNAGWNLTDDPRTAGQMVADHGTATPAASTAPPPARSSGFTFQIIEESPTTAAVATAETALAKPDDDELEPFPEPDFDAYEDDDAGPGDAGETPEEEVYFGPMDGAEDYTAQEPGTREQEWHALAGGGDQTPTVTAAIPADDHVDDIPVLSPETLVESESDALLFFGSEDDDDADAGPRLEPLETTEIDALGDLPATPDATAEEQDSDDVLVPDPLSAPASDAQELRAEDLWPSAFDDDDEALPAPADLADLDDPDDTLSRVLELDDDVPPPHREEHPVDFDDSLDLPDVERYFGLPGDTGEIAVGDLQPSTAEVGEDEDDLEADTSVFVTAEEDSAHRPYEAIRVKMAQDSRAQDEDLLLPDELPDFDVFDDTAMIEMLEEAEKDLASLSEKEAAASADETAATEDATADAVAGPEPDTSAGDRDTPGFVQRLFRRAPESTATAGTDVVLDPLQETQLVRSLQRSRPPRWSTGLGSTALTLVNVGLTLLLLLQAGYFYMDQLVRVPGLRPVLEAGCALAACEVPQPQNLTLVEQLSSRMHPAREGGGLVVHATLINRDIREQPYPPLELALLDRHGNLISRRVLRASDYINAAEGRVTMPAGIAQEIQIHFRSPSTRVDGFELRPVALGWRQRG